MTVQVRPDGPIPARIMIVGEAPGAEDERNGIPFCGAAGSELTKMLHEAQINRSECFLTYVARERPFNNDIGAFIASTKKEITRDHSEVHGRWVKAPIISGLQMLEKEILLVQPNIIIALGNAALWALTGEWGILKWRGSMLYARDKKTQVIPTIHPASVLRQWELRSITVQDLRRAARYRNGERFPTPTWKFQIRPTFQTVASTLDNLLSKLTAGTVELSFDIETRLGHTACAGISWTQTEGICIPLMCVEDRTGFWSVEEETEIILLLRRVLCHPNAQVVGQNLLYDCQYTWRHWVFVPSVHQDTMVSQHVCFPGLKKSLDFQASMYCESYRYWKDDSKDWDPKMGEDQLWVYNVEDCVRTQECAKVERDLIKKMGLEAVHDFQQKLFWPVLQAMIRGVRIDHEARRQMSEELHRELLVREEFFLFVCGHKLNPRSPKNMMEFFYGDLNLPPIISRKTKNPTLDDEALAKLAQREPLLQPIIRAISEYRSIGVFRSTFVDAELDSDGRMRCSYNICGTETFRFSSAQNAFGSGTNLQNIPKGSKGKEVDDLSLPNIRKLFVPDEGYTFFDMDLDRADLQVVVWEADDLELKQMLHEGVDIHAENAKALGISRALAKSWVHGTNYGGSARTMAINCGITIRDAEKMRARWFQIHPGIERWHRRTELQLHHKHYVENRFGYRRHYFDRVDGLLPEALAWVPQSTVACVINRAWLNIYDHLPEVQVLLQVHDSLAGQFPTTDTAHLLSSMRGLARISIPYPDPLIIPVGIKTSPISWGHCE